MPRPEESHANWSCREIVVVAITEGFAEDGEEEHHEEDAGDEDSRSLQLGQVQRPVRASLRRGGHGGGRIRRCKRSGLALERGEEECSGGCCCCRQDYQEPAVEEAH